MRFWHSKSSNARVGSTVSRLIVLLAALLFLQQQCQARQPLASQSDGGFGTAVGWAYCGLAIVLLAGGVAVVFWRTKTQRRQTRAPIWAALFKNKPPISTATSNPLSVGPKNGKSNRHRQPISVSNHSHGSKPFHRKHRRRIFDYSKFYTKVMSELSPHSYGPPKTTDGKFKSHPHANGHGGHNGHANVHLKGQAASNGPNISRTIKSEIEDLIAVQKSMIQEQKHLLEEQTRLIEEKRWLIEEQAAFLKIQSGLVADQQHSRLKFEK